MPYQITPICARCAKEATDVTVNHLDDTKKAPFRAVPEDWGTPIDDNPNRALLCDDCYPKFRALQRGTSDRVKALQIEFDLQLEEFFK